MYETIILRYGDDTLFVYLGRGNITTRYTIPIGNVYPVQFQFNNDPF